MSSESIFHNYVKDGIYEVGEHGITIWDDFKYKTLLALLNQDISDEELEEKDQELLYGYDFGEGAKILVIQMEGEECDKLTDVIYKIILLENGDQDTVTVECEHHMEYPNTPIDERDVFYGTDHSIFSSGNIKPLYYLRDIKDEKYLETFYNQYDGDTTGN